MFALGLIPLTVALLVAMSVAADRRFRGEARLPMQWGLGGQVNWTAPRRVGLAFTPVLALVLLAIIGFGASSARQPMHGSPTAAIAIAAAAFLAAHLLHLTLIARSLRR